MRILFIGDYSNVHATLARELRRRGHAVTVVSDGCGHMRTDTDIHLGRGRGLTGAVRYLTRLFGLLPGLRGYDAVQLINPHFLSLRPGRIRYFFKELKRHNGGMFLTLAGNDHHFVRACHEGRMFRFSEFRTGTVRTPACEASPEMEYDWLSRDVRLFSEYIYGELAGAMSLLPEYDMASRPALGDRLLFTGLPIDLSSFGYSPLVTDDRVNLFVGMRSFSVARKGTDRLLDMVRGIERDMPDRCVVTNVRDMPLDEYNRQVGRAHIVFDQLYSYSPGMNALGAMAMGRVAATGAEPEYYSYIGEPDERPILRLSPLDPDIEERVRALVADPRPLAAMGAAGRRLVERHHDVRHVAGLFERHWQESL